MDALCSKHMLVALNVLLIVVCHILGPWTLVGTAQCHQSWPCHHHSEISVLPKVGEMNECFSCVLHVFSLVFCANMSLIWPVPRVKHSCSYSDSGSAYHPSSLLSLVTVSFILHPIPNTCLKSLPLWLKSLITFIMKVVSDFSPGDKKWTFFHTKSSKYSKPFITT